MNLKYIAVSLLTLFALSFVAVIVAVCVAMFQFFPTNATTICQNLSVDKLSFVPSTLINPESAFGLESNFLRTCTIPDKVTSYALLWI